MAPRLFFAALLAAVLSILPSCAEAAAVQQQYMGGAVPFKFRSAVLEDIDDLTTVFVDAFSTLPEWSYIHQFEDDYPGYTWHCTYKQWKTFLERAEDIGLTVNVIAVPDRTAETGERVVSFGAWYLNRTAGSWGVSELAILSGGLCSLPPDINATRSERWSALLLEAHKKYLDAVYDHHTYLLGLATHPKWDGNGFAATHLRWGLASADDAGLPAGLLATSFGQPLYRTFGFENLYNVTLERDDGKGIIWHEVMARPAKNTTG